MNWYVGLSFFFFFEGYFGFMGEELDFSFFFFCSHFQIRVTKHVGKKLKLVIRSAMQCDVEDVEIKLVDLKRGGEMVEFGMDKVVLKENDLDGVDIEYDLKLFSLSRSLEFEVFLQTKFGKWKQSSLCFGSHNSGKNRIGYC